MDKAKLLMSFPKMLGRSCSLADLDFLDTCGKKPNESGAKDAYDVYMEVFEGWPREDLEIIEEQLNRGAITNKEYGWDYVKADYLALHAHGIVYLDCQGLAFYLAAWIFLYMSDDGCDVGLFSDFMLTRLAGLSENSLNKAQGILSCFSLEQKHIISQFLKNLKQRDSIKYMQAEDCLNSGWGVFIK